MSRRHRPAALGTVVVAGGGFGVGVVMRMSLHPSLLGTGTTIGWPEMVSVASGAGFDAVDLPLRETAASEQAAAVVERLGAARVGVGGVQLPVEFRRDEETFRREYADLPALAQFAAAIGATTMCRALPASSKVAKAELVPVIRRRLAECAGVLADSDIRLGLEFMGPLHLRQRAAHEFVWRMDETAEFARSCGTNVGVLLDSWHWHHAGAGVQDVIDAGDLICHVQVADAADPADVPPAEVRDDSRLLPGMGVVDFDGFFRALAAVGYDGAVSPEVFGYRCGFSAVRCARAAMVAVSGVATSAAAPGRPSPIR